MLTKLLATPQHMQLLQLINLSANESLHPAILNTEASLIMQNSTNHTHSLYEQQRMVATL